MARKLILIFLGLGLLLLLPACGAPAAEAPAEEAPAEEEPAAEEPPAPEVMPTALPTQDLPIPTQAATAIPNIPEQRRLTLEFPPKIRAGDSDLVRLTLEMDDLGNITPTAEIDGNEIIGEMVEIPNLYETHTIIAESRLDMAGLEVIPSETVSEPLLPGESVTFYWSLSAEDVGEYRGTVWLYLRFMPKEGGEESVKTLSAQIIEIRSTKFFGIVSSSPAKKIGAIGSLLGAILGFPFVDDVFKFLWKRVKK
jgi:hypothetical protein